MEVSVDFQSIKKSCPKINYLANTGSKECQYLFTDLTLIDRERSSCCPRFLKPKIINDYIQKERKLEIERANKGSERYVIKRTT